MTFHYEVNEIFLRVLGVVFLILGWLPVLNPAIRIHHKGGNRAPLSKQSKWLLVLTTTSWALVAWDIAPFVFAPAFAASILCGLVLSRRDRKRYDKETGAMPRVPMGREQTWMISSVFVGVMWMVWLLIVVRDHFWPPSGQDADVLLYMARGFLGFFTLLAALLYAGRPKEKPSSDRTVGSGLS